MTIFAYDQKKLSRVVIGFPGKALNHYYCAKGSYLVSVQRAAINDDFLTIDKSFYKISIESRLDTPDHIRITFKDHSIDKECVSRVQVKPHLTCPEDDSELFEARRSTAEKALDAAAVSFQLSSKQFKKTVNDAAKRSAATITVEKLGVENPLQIVYAKAGHRCNEIYRTDEKIALRSTLGSQELMRCTLGIDSIKSLAGAMVADDIRIYCYPDGSGRDTVFMSFIGDEQDEDEQNEDGEGGRKIIIGTVVTAFTP
jgi:hypothetical protein